MWGSVEEEGSKCVWTTKEERTKCQVSVPRRHIVLPRPGPGRARSRTEPMPLGIVSAPESGPLAARKGNV
jgi:hypothetical protein